MVTCASLLIMLFVVLVLTKDTGKPDLPMGYVAIVEGVPDKDSQISRAAFDQAFAQQVVQAKLAKTPGADSDHFDELKSAALSELLDRIWIQGEAEELNISVTDKEVRHELEAIKEQRFPDKGAYEKFLKDSKFTQDDVEAQARVKLISSKIRAAVIAQAPRPSDTQIQTYYEREKRTRFSTEVSRNIRLIANEDKAAVEAAKDALKKDSSPANWKKVAAKYSSDPLSNKKGGLQTGIQEEFLLDPLKKPISAAAAHELIGPIKVENNNLLLEVVQVNPAGVKPLKEVEAEVARAVRRENQEEFFADWVSDYQAKWRSRTFCADGFVIERCENYGEATAAK